MSAVTRALLLLLLAAIGTKAAPAPKDCGVLKNLTITDLHVDTGDWVLVWSVADHHVSWDLTQNLSSSHLEFSVLPDNHTVVLKERNVFPDKPCSKYFMNFTLADNDNHTLELIAGTMEKDGIVSPYNESLQLDFYESCAECLMIVYTSPSGRYLLNYRKEGHHHDVEEMKTQHDAHKKLAECLGIPHDQQFNYDGVADFCHKKSSPKADDAATVAPVLS